MTIGMVRGVLTLTLFAAFIALWVWAWGKQRRTDFDVAARLPLEDEMAGSMRGERP